MTVTQPEKKNIVKKIIAENLGKEEESSKGAAMQHNVQTASVE